MDNKIKNKASVLKKTDSAVKTAEAWTAFATAIWEAKGFFTPVTLLAGVMITAFLDVITLGWGYAVFAGIGMFILASVIWLGVSWLWYLRPAAKQARESKSPPLEQAGKENESSLEKILDRISALEKTNSADEFTEYVARYVGDATAKMDRLEGTFHAKFHTLTEENRRGIDALFANKKTSDVMKFAELAEILDAKNHLERFDEVSAEIDEAVKHLDKIPLCENWSGRHQYFKGRLNEWDSFRNHYSIPEYKPLFEVEPNELKSAGWGAPVNKLPTDEGIEYKHYRLALQAYQKNHKPMRRRISYIAKKSFYGRAAKGSYMERFER